MQNFQTFLTVISKNKALNSKKGALSYDCSDEKKYIYRSFYFWKEISWNFERFKAVKVAEICKISEKAIDKIFA